MGLFLQLVKRTAGRFQVSNSFCPCWKLFKSLQWTFYLCPQHFRIVCTLWSDTKQVHAQWRKSNYIGRDTSWPGKSFLNAPFIAYKWIRENQNCCFVPGSSTAWEQIAAGSTSTGSGSALVTARSLTLNLILLTSYNLTFSSDRCGERSGERAPLADDCGDLSQVRPPLILL